MICLGTRRSSSIIARNFRLEFSARTLTPRTTCGRSIQNYQRVHITASISKSVLLSSTLLLSVTTNSVFFLPALLESLYLSVSMLSICSCALAAPCTRMISISAVTVGSWHAAMAVSSMSRPVLVNFHVFNSSHCECPPQYSLMCSPTRLFSCAPSMIHAGQCIGYTSAQVQCSMGQGWILSTLLVPDPQ